MTATERDLVVGFLIAGLLSAGLSERARTSLRATARRMAPASAIGTTVAQSGWLGGIGGRAAVAGIRLSGGQIVSPYVQDRLSKTRFPVHVRRSVLRASDVEFLGMRVRRLRAVQSNTVVDGDDILRGRAVELVSAGTGEAEIVVDTAAVERAAASKAPQLRNVRVAIGSGQLSLNGDSALPVGRLTAVAKLAVRNGCEVVMTDPQVWIDGNALAGPLVQGMVGALNPVFSLDESGHLRERYAIREVRMGEGVLRVVLDIHPRNGRKAIP